jgi:hypothetical protein
LIIFTREIEILIFAENSVAVLHVFLKTKFSAEKKVEMPLFFRHTMYYKTGTSSKRTWQCLRCLVFAFVSKNILLSMLHRFYQMNTSSKKIPIFQCTFRILALVALYLLEGKFMQSRI